MAIDLVRLVTEASDEDIAKAILSSGDFFPGFYRFTLGTRNEEFGQLTATSLIHTFLTEQTVGTQYPRYKWTEFSKKRLGDQSDRSAERADKQIHERLVSQYSDWSLTATEYDIAVVETEEDVNTIEPDTTYFFMGSMIRFVGPQTMLVGYDMLRDEYVLSLDVDVNKMIDYITNIYADDLRMLFLRADLVASLSFDQDDIGTLDMTDTTIARAITAAENVVIASNRDTSSKLPIRWAKDILLSDVTNGEMT